jgi:Na+(H+)/acetate symporter ActP
VRYFHVLPLSVHIHILSLSLHAMSKSSQIEYSECMTLVTMVLTIYVWILKKTNIHSYKAFSFVFTFLSCLSFSCQFPVSFLSLPSMFLLFPSIISLFYVHLI